MSFYLLQEDGTSKLLLEDLSGALLLEVVLVSSSDSFTLNTGDITIVLSVAVGETIAATSTDSVSTVSITPVASSDSATVDDEAARSASDTDVSFLTETQSVATVTLTAVSSSDSSTLTDTESVTVPVLPVSSDSVAVSDAASVVTLTDSNINSSDTLQFAEAWNVAVGISSSDTATVTSNDGGPPGGGGAGDGGGTGSGGGPGVVVTFGRLHAHHPRHS